MYRKDSEGWLKHGDFIVLDMICLQLAFILAYAFRGYGFNVYGDILYRNMAIFLGFADLVVIFTSGTMKSVLKRGHYKEFVTTLKNAVAVGALAIAYLFIIQEGQSFSRMILITTIVIYLILTYAIREIWKNSLHKKMENGGDKKLLIITSKAVAENVVHSMQENNYARYSLAGVVVIDEDCTGEKICGVPVVAGESDVPMYVCQEWIDEVLIVISENLPYPDGLIDKLTETGVTVHLNLAKITNQTGKRQFVEKVGSYTVLTTSLNYASFGQLFLKRLMDICGGLVAVLANGLDICYPSEHEKLKECIENKGLVISEYPPGIRPTKYTFPKRNRLISAWSDELIVVAAGKKSGALITADYSKKYGRKIIYCE